MNIVNFCNVVLCFVTLLPSTLNYRVLHYHGQASRTPIEPFRTGKISASATRVAPTAVAVKPAPKGRIRRTLWSGKRTCYIWASAFKHIVQLARIRRRQLRGTELVAARQQFASDLRDTLIRLGPTFIKIGQILSTRIDIFSPEVIKELATLQNEVPSFPSDRALAIIREELGCGVEELFESFDRRPLAAASLAQVHRAVLRSGEEVIVKVQRENLLDLFEVDLWNINLVARLADRFDPQTEGTASNWKGIAETSGEVLYREVDFGIEIEAAQLFAKNFESVDAIKVPAVFPNFSSKKVVTMEYCPGVKISDLEALEKQGYDRVHLSTQLTNSYLEQVCRHGFFHCDPHPGNLAVDSGYPGGRLIYYDFGMMEPVEPGTKKGFVDLIFCVYENNPRGVCDAMEDMGILRKGVERYSIERIARDMLNVFETTLASADNKWENEMTPEERKAARRARRAKLGQDLFATQAEKPFELPPAWSFVFRAFSTIDGICKGLDSKFDLSAVSQPYLRELANLRDGSLTTSGLKEVGRQLGLRPKDIKQVVKQPRTIADIAERIQRIEDGDVKLRVRALEVERMMDQVKERQTMFGAGLLAAALYQLSVLAVGQPLRRWAFAVGACRCAFESWRSGKCLRKLEAQQLRFQNKGDERFDEDEMLAGF
jgi:predicted unusual protein kinase regulating ubiquinone biosynthesis (AarF/ABC1/UbiB family)